MAVEKKTVARPSRVSALREASICFYGQKHKNFIALHKTRLLERIERLLEASDFNNVIERKGSENKFRIYNLGGIPMLCNLVNHSTRVAKNIDAVVELKGQKAHDFVPGAFIAMKGGAYACDLMGKKMTFGHLEELLLRPAYGEQRYVVAATKELAEEIVASL